MRSSRFEAPITMTFFRLSTPSISARSCGTIVLSMSDEMPVPRAEQRVHLVEEHDDGEPSSDFSRPLEDEADLALGLADVLVEELRALDVEEEGAGARVAGLLGDPLGERVRHRLGDERLAAARRAVEEDALRRLELVLVEQVRVEVRQLDRVLDLLDLVVEAADVVVGDVGDLFEDELLDLGPGRRSTRSPERPSMRRWSPARSFSPSRRRRARRRAPRRRPTIRARSLPSRSSLEDDDLAGDVGADGRAPR